MSSSTYHLLLSIGHPSCYEPAVDMTKKGSTGKFPLSDALLPYIHDNIAERTGSGCYTILAYNGVTWLPSSNLLSLGGLSFHELGCFHLTFLPVDK